jgi:hypothetical protein
MWHTDSWVISHCNALTFLILAKVFPRGGGDSWWLMTVYGLANDAQKPRFL